MNMHRGPDRGLGIPSPAADRDYRGSPQVEVAGQSRQASASETHLENLSRIYQRLGQLYERSLRLADIHTGCVPASPRDPKKDVNPVSTVAKMHYATSLIDEQITEIESALRRLEDL